MSDNAPADLTSWMDGYKAGYDRGFQHGQHPTNRDGALDRLLTDAHVSERPVSGGVQHPIITDLRDRLAAVEQAIAKNGEKTGGAIQNAIDTHNEVRHETLPATFDARLDDAIAAHKDQDHPHLADTPGPVRDGHQYGAQTYPPAAGPPPPRRGTADDLPAVLLHQMLDHLWDEYGRAAMPIPDNLEKALRHWRENDLNPNRRQAHPDAEAARARAAAVGGWDGVRYTDWQGNPVPCPPGHCIQCPTTDIAEIG